MFDYYEPVPAPVCPWCGAAFEVWQGKDGPNALFVWRQGDARPVDQRVEDESRTDPARLPEFALPDRFTIHGWCVSGHGTQATGQCREGVWTRFDLSPDDLRYAAEKRERDRIGELRRSWSREP